MDQTTNLFYIYLSDLKDLGNDLLHFKYPKYEVNYYR